MGEARGCQAGNSSFLCGTLLIGDDSLPPPFPLGTVFMSLTQEVLRDAMQMGFSVLHMGSLHPEMQTKSPEGLARSRKISAHDAFGKFKLKDIAAWPGMKVCVLWSLLGPLAPCLTAGEVP